MSQLTTREVTLRDLFTSCDRLQVPVYQRGYSWTTHEVARLLDDLELQIAGGSPGGHSNPFFLGIIVLMEEAQSPPPVAQNGNGWLWRRSGRSIVPPSSGVSEVVDGQQRLITLTILFAVLRDLLGEDLQSQFDALIIRDGEATSGDPESVRLGVKTADQAFFLKQVQAEGATRSRKKATKLSPSQANILANRNAIRRRLRQWEPEELDQLASLLLDHSKVLRISTDDIDYAYNIFLSINDRHKRLTTTDILRGEIAGAIHRDQLERYASIVEQIEKYVSSEGKNSSNVQPARRNKTFFSHLHAAHGWSGQAIIKDLRRLVRQTGGPGEFTERIFAPMAECYITIKSGKYSGADPDAKVHDALVLLRWLETFGNDDWLPVAMLYLASANDDPDRVASFLCALDRFAIGMLMLKRGHARRRGRYREIILELRRAGAHVNPHELLRFEPSEEEAIVRNIAQCPHEIAAQTCKLLLLRVDLHWSGRRPGDYEPILDGSGRQAISVEHVLPRNPGEGQQWCKDFPDPAMRRHYCQSIGNLTLVSEGKNTLLDNQDFPAKRELLLKAVNCPFHLTKEVAGYTEWKPETINGRQAKLMTAIYEIWQFKGDYNAPRCPVGESDRPTRTRSRGGKKRASVEAGG